MRRIPRYMNPDYIILLKSLLRLPLGKADRRMPQHPEIASDRDTHRAPNDASAASYSLVPTDERPHHESPSTTQTNPLTPHNDSRAGTAELILPRNNTERIISDIWANSLGREVVSITDDFFDLGGSSLTALEIMMGMEHAFKIQLPVDILFNKRTVMALACAIDALPTVQLEAVNNGREQIEL